MSNEVEDVLAVLAEVGSDDDIVSLLGLLLLRDPPVPPYSPSEAVKEARKILAAFAEAGIACVHVPTNVKVTHGARLVPSWSPGGPEFLYSIHDTKSPSEN